MGNFTSIYTSVVDAEHAEGLIGGYDNEIFASRSELEANIDWFAREYGRNYEVFGVQTDEGWRIAWKSTAQEHVGRSVS